MSWSLYKLKSLASNEPYSFVGGPFGSKLTSRDYVDYGVPVIRGSNLNNGRFLDMNEFVFVTDAKVREDLFGNLAKPGDLVFTQRGTLGQVAIIPENGISDQYVVSQSQMKLTIDETKADKLFLYYYFSSHQAIQKILSFTSSSGVPHINLTVLRNFEVPVPPLNLQKKIASTLSAYDDLIENNRRRIQLLEESARLLYKEWFVHLRFPGHEHVTIHNGIPDGWKKTNLFELAQATYGHAFKSKQFVEEPKGIPVVRIRDVPRGESNTYTSEEAPEEKLLDDGDFIVGMDGDFHINFWVGGRAWLNQRVVKITPKTNTLSVGFIRFALEKPIQDFNATIVGTTVAHLGAKHLKTIELLIPPDYLLSQIDENLETFRHQIIKLQKQSQAAVKARDILLPRLMNGEIAV